MCSTLIVEGKSELSGSARILRTVHSSVGVFELGCLIYLWLCAITRRRDRWFALAVSVLIGEGAALPLGRGCPLGIFQRRAGDDVPMFELWFGPRFAPYAIPSFTSLAVAGLVVAMARSPHGVRWMDRLQRVSIIASVCLSATKTVALGDSTARSRLFERDGTRVRPDPERGAGGSTLRCMRASEFWCVGDIRRWWRGVVSALLVPSLLEEDR